MFWHLLQVLPDGGHAIFMWHTAATYQYSPHASKAAWELCMAVEEETCCFLVPSAGRTAINF